MGLKFRSARIEDAKWMNEVANDPEVAKHLISVYPTTEHEDRERLKKALEDGKPKMIIAELDGEAAGCVNISLQDGRTRHLAWLGIYVRRRYWGQGVGTALMKEAIRVAKELGCRRLMLGTEEGNERAIRLYRKFGFKTEATCHETTYIDGGWKSSPLMGLDLAPCEPHVPQQVLSRNINRQVTFSQQDVKVRQLIDDDLEEVNRLQNCVESTKTSDFRIPPTTKEATKKWYEELSASKGRFCYGFFKGKKLLGYVRFRTAPPPFLNLKVVEMLVDVNGKPKETTDVLISALKGFFERYSYHKIFWYTVPENNPTMIESLEAHECKRTGALKNYLFIDEHYVDALCYEYP